MERDSSPEAFEKLRRYVQKRLLDSGFPEHQANPVNPESVAARIVGDAWHQPDPYYFADLDIEHAIRYPPNPIDSNHFSLRAFIKQQCENMSGEMRLEKKIHECQSKHGLKYCSRECVDFMNCRLLSEFLKRSKEKQT